MSPLSAEELERVAEVETLAEVVRIAQRVPFIGPTQRRIARAVLAAGYSREVAS